MGVLVIQFCTCIGRLVAKYGGFKKANFWDFFVYKVLVFKCFVIFLLIVKIFSRSAEKLLHAPLYLRHTFYRNGGHYLKCLFLSIFSCKYIIFRFSFFVLYNLYFFQVTMDTDFCYFCFVHR